MTSYEQQAHIELQFWQHRMQKKPSFTDKVSKTVQTKINDLIPDKVHAAITTTIEKMIKAVLFGAKYTTSTSPELDTPLQLRESLVRQKIETYRNTATVEGAVTGAGGFLMGMADFPILIGIKLKLLFEIAALYGYDVKDYKERLYILYIFQLAFSSQQRRNEVYELMAGWQGYSGSLPGDADEFDWRIFQQEYRDYIDLAKLAQLLPVIGAAVGAIANYKLIAQLGETAMNCYRMRKISPLEIIKE
ncbi:EcsC family protein [Mucilaginibacter aquatilis]|uniref:EcsC family protein n=1 Tax=Mucilaginibacter aquatilis TaxID=1517760 RepID=A0A6I4I479_9SPHI|nr:EcsC family protein [Mucilaginibacter aquatilis]MVN89861.1 EcsC family protein [Mucilaginibacter aquatilis]